MVLSKQMTIFVLCSFDHQAWEICHLLLTRRPHCGKQEEGQYCYYYYYYYQMQKIERTLPLTYMA
jgi:hypothetical protein